MTVKEKANGAIVDIHYIEVEPGVELSVIRSGRGEPIIILPGWSQTAEQWRDHISWLSNSHLVFAIDMRGHGKSSKPDHGYRISRLAADLHAVIEAEDLHGVTLLGHSMGCAVIWSYLELYGASGVKKLILVDQGPSIVSDPSRSDEQKRTDGSIFSGAELLDLLTVLRGPESVDSTSNLLRSMVSDGFAAQRLEWLLEQNLTMPREAAARLFLDHAYNNWTDLIRRIDIPSLVIGAKGSIIPWESMAAIGEMIKGSETFIFEVEDGGSHFAFLENPTKFRKLIEGFLDL